MSNAKAAPRQRALPLSDWPPADRDAWLAATASSGLLGDAGIASHLAPSTRDDLTRRYAYFLAFAKRTGRLVSEGPPACNVIEDAITAYVQDLEEYASSVTVHGSVIKAMRVAECVAPQMDWLWLRVLCRRLETRMIGRNKRPRMVDVGRLLDLGIELMDAAEKSKSKSSFGKTILYRDGLMVSLLAACPIRRGNFASLEIGRTLINTGTRWTVVLPSAETKNRRHFEMPVAPELTPYLNKFLAIYRPTFGGTDRHNLLWPSRKGQPLSAGAIYHVISRRTKDVFGFGINPHLFRDCCVTTIARHHGAHIGVAIALLGHQDPKIIERHYNHAGMVDAVRAYQDAVAKMRG